MVEPREYSQVRRIAGTLPLGLRLFSPVATRSSVVVVVVVETLGETRAQLRNANCVEDAAEDATTRTAIETPSPSLRFYNEPKAKVDDRIWLVGFAGGRSDERRLRREGVPTYLFRILPAYICINSAQALRHSHRTNPPTSFPLPRLIRGDVLGPGRGNGRSTHGRVVPPSRRSAAAISIIPLVKKSLVTPPESIPGAREGKKI